ncbi:MAG: hypothetical protein ABIJ28_00535 [Patescibacteria group bacterium]
MPINFNGNVNINGNVEMYGDGSMKITGTEPIEININNLSSYIEKELPISKNKESYKEAADILLNPPQDKNKIIEAIKKLEGFVKESGRAIWIGGLSGFAQEVVKEVVRRI